jgi:transcriptional regulator with XRE-family HTH domain
MTKPLLPGSKRYELAKTIGRRIRAFRQERNFSREEVAVMVGVQRDRIAAYEEGAAIPPVFTLVRLSQAMKTTLDGLVFEESVVPLNNQRVIDCFREVSALPLPSQLVIVWSIGPVIAWMKAVQEKK